MLKLSFPITIAAVIFMLFGVNAAFGQCGADGKQPCTTTTKKITPKKTTVTKPKTTVTKPTVTKPKTTTKKRQTTTTADTTTDKPCAVSDNFNNKDAPANSTQTINGVKFEFVGIPSGSFCMGSNDGRDNEKPVHRVILSKSFWMGKTEVTQGQWKAVMGNNPSEFNNCGENCPVTGVSWDDAQDFIRKLNKQGEGTYRLPTEAEWEYAARAGSTTKYSYGDGASSLENYAWYEANSGDTIHEVATKQTNDWGLYDMHGNVREWCQDKKDNYSSGTVTNPTATSGFDRVLRGSCYRDDAVFSRSAQRNSFSPSLRNMVGLGFRLVKN